MFDFTYIKFKMGKIMPLKRKEEIVTGRGHMGFFFFFWSLISWFLEWSQKYTKMVPKLSSYKAMVFLVVRYGCERCTIEKAESRGIDGFKLWSFEKTVDNPLDSMEIKPFNPKGNQPWIFIGRTDAEAEAPILWPPDAETTHWKRLRCWERLRAGGEGGNRGWDGSLWPIWSTVLPLALSHQENLMTYPQYSAGPNVTRALRTTVKNCREKRSFIPPNELVITHAMLGEVREDYA